ncbi:hypothetical protein [Ketobacter sp.]
MNDITMEDTSARPINGPLNSLNKQFHDQLLIVTGSTRQRLDNGSIPVVVRLDSRIVLAKGRSRSVFTINDTYYHQLKALAHIPLFLFLSALNGNTSEREKNQVMTALSDIRTDENFTAADLSPIQDAVQTLVNSSEWPLMEYVAVRKFNRTLQPAFQSLIALAAKDEAEQTLKALHDIDNKLDDPYLSQQCFYVVCAGHQPRYKLLGKQMFERWIFEKTKSHEEVERRVLYGESLESVDAARELVVTRLVNELIGEAFLNSPLSMNQDVLGQAGELAVEAVFRE